jgi:chromosome segregation ATPase
MFKNFLYSVPFVLCNLFAPDDGGGAGGGGQEPPPNPDPEPPPPTKPDEPQGETIEARLKNAGTIIANYFRRIGELTSQLATLNTQRTRLEGQFNAAAGDLAKEKGEHKKTKDLLSSANTTIAGLTSERDSANGNVERLETLCSLRGIDASAAVPVPPENAGAANTGAAKWEKYNELKDQERKGQKPAGTAMAYWRENKKALDDYAASKRVAA